MQARRYSWQWRCAAGPSDTDVTTDYLINQEDYYVALAMRQRLEGEINFAAPVFDNMLSSSRPDIVAEQLKVFHSRLEEHFGPNKS